MADSSVSDFVESTRAEDTEQERLIREFQTSLTRFGAQDDVTTVTDAPSARRDICSRGYRAWEAKMNRATGIKTAPIAKKCEDRAKTDPTIEQIRRRAYELYLFRGGRAGDALEDWLEAEREVLDKQCLTL